MRIIRLVRHLLHVPARQLAEAAHVSERQLRRIERGAVRPLPETLDALDAAIAATLDARLARSNTTPAPRD